MLYLAEIQKQKTGFIGAAKAEIKLLAFQRADQSWNPVQGEELIPAEEANNFNSGALVIADLNANRQVQRIQDAGRPLVSILQNFSRQLEKAKSQEEEIEQWKESLKYQSEEMNRRHVEMEARLEQLEQIEEEYKQLQSSPSQQGLDETTVSQVEELLARLSQGLIPTAAGQQELNIALQMIETQQAKLNPHWQELEEQKHTAQQQQAEVDNQAMMLQNGRQEWHLAQNALTKNNAALEQLQQIVQDLHRDWESASRFVHEQEEELRLKQQAINELQMQLGGASDGERTNLETELADERDSYDFLHQTLVGQRQNLQERKETLRQHQTMLWQRQGISIGNRQEDYKLDLDPILSQVQMQKQQQILTLQKLEQEIEQIQSSIEQTRGQLDDQVREQETKWQEMQNWEQNLLSLRVMTAECWARVNLYQEMLRPIQDSLDGLRQKLQAIASVLEQSQETGEHQAAIAQIRQTLIRT